MPARTGSLITGFAKLTKHKPAAKTAVEAEGDATLETQEKDRQFVTALARGLDVLRCFTRLTPAISPV
jgi:hypothetical protein